MSDKILPVILCGGTGTRLWPVSREGMAKQLLPILGDQTLLQMTLARVSGNGFGAPMVIGSHAVRFTIRDQVEAVAPEARVVIEPERRRVSLKDETIDLTLAARPASETPASQAESDGSGGSYLGIVGLTLTPEIARELAMAELRQQVAAELHRD